MWLFENSVGFNRFLVSLLNERLGQFIALTEYGRRLDATGRLGAALPRCSTRSSIATRPGIWISPRKSSVPSSAFRGQKASNALQTLEKEGLLRLEYGGVTVVDLEKLGS